mmetsp:Transcript_23111/g.61698  ORF Transcript_23111/g.61698 Transcript_23111/m.61698 type:complete len:337 (-) Transcript_23111:866-1876(-)
MAIPLRVFRGEGGGGTLYCLSSDFNLRMAASLRSVVTRSSISFSSAKRMRAFRMCMHVCSRCVTSKSLGGGDSPSPSLCSAASRIAFRSTATRSDSLEPSPFNRFSSSLIFSVNTACWTSSRRSRTFTCSSPSASGSCSSASSNSFEAHSASRSFTCCFRDSMSPACSTANAVAASACNKAVARSSSSNNFSSTCRSRSRFADSSSCCSCELSSLCLPSRSIDAASSLSIRCRSMRLVSRSFVRYRTVFFSLSRFCLRASSLPWRFSIDCECSDDCIRWAWEALVISVTDVLASNVLASSLARSWLFSIRASVASSLSCCFSSCSLSFSSRSRSMT